MAVDLAVTEWSALGAAGIGVLVVEGGGRVVVCVGEGVLGLAERPRSVAALPPALAERVARARDGFDEERDLDGRALALHGRPGPGGGAVLLAVTLPAGPHPPDARLLRAIFDHVPVAIHAADARRRILAANPASEVLLGWYARELVGGPVPPIAVEDAGVDAGFRGERVETGDVAFHRRDGSARILRRRIAPMPDPSGGRGIVVAFEDVTERRADEDAEARLAAVVRAALDPIVALDAQGTVLSWNEAATRVFGLPAEAAIGRGIAGLFGSCCPERVTGLVAAVARGERLVDYDLDVGVGPDRVELTWSLAPILAVDGAVVGAAGVARDVTTERRQQRALARAAERSAALAEVSRAMLASPLDVRATYESIARSLAEHVGDACVLRLASASAATLDVVAIHHRDPAALALLVDVVPPSYPVQDSVTGECYRTGRPVQMESASGLPPSVREAYGDYVERRNVVAITCVPILARERCLGTIGVHYEARSTEPSPEDLELLVECGRRAGDALDRARLYEEAREARRRAERARTRLVRMKADLEARVSQRTTALSALLEDVEMMSYAMSHDLQQGMRHIDANAALVLEDCAELVPLGKERLGRVRAAARRASQLVERLVDIARIARPELQLERVDLSTVVEAIAAELHARDPERAVAWDVQPGVATRADRQLIHVALRHLLENGWKFTAPHPSAHIAFGAERDGDTTAFYVRDDGIGFDMAFAAQLFSPLRQLNPPSAFEGAGLGLATVRHIVERMGGRVWAHGEPGRGATFWFTLE